jgi:hypothetical protein
LLGSATLPKMGGQAVDYRRHGLGAAGEKREAGTQTIAPSALPVAQYTNRQRVVNKAASLACGLALRALLTAHLPFPLVFPPEIVVLLS